MAKQLIIKIRPDGTVESQTKNIKGKACEKYIPILEKMAAGQTVDSDYTPEYYETDNLLVSQNPLEQGTTQGGM